MSDAADQLGLPPHSFDFDTRYSNVIDVQFVSQALASGARCVRGARWATHALYPADAPEVIATAYYEYNRSFEALAAVEGVLAHVIRQGDMVTLRLAGADLGSVDRAEGRLREQLPEPTPGSPHDLTVEFSYWARQAGVSVTARTLTVATLDEVRFNYTSHVQAQLARLTASFVPGSSGRLLLWHGPPGCGKTWALRALASEWRSWCTLRYVTDPEVLLNEPAYLMNLVHMRPNGRDEESWRLIVMEDTGELRPLTPSSRLGRVCPGFSMWSTGFSVRARRRSSL